MPSKVLCPSCKIVYSCELEQPYATYGGMDACCPNCNHTFEIDLDHLIEVVFDISEEQIDFVFSRHPALSFDWLELYLGVLLTEPWDQGRFQELCFQKKDGGDLLSYGQIKPLILGSKKARAYVYNRLQDIIR